MFGWLRREPNQLAQRRLEMSRLLADYPIYDPPHWQSPNCRRQSDSLEYRQLLRDFAERGRENLAYFMDQRVARLAALRCFLTKFSVNMTVDESGVAAVSAWCPRNCGSLAANLRSPTTRQIFFQHFAPWTDEWRGMNVIFDLGVFLGECLIARNNRLHWAYHPGTI